MTRNSYIDTFFFFLVILIPPTQILGPAVPDIIISLFSLYYLIYLILFDRKKINAFYSHKWLIYGIAFCIGAILVSLLNDNYTHSLKSSIPYFRFLLFAFLLNLYFLSNEKNFKLLIYVIGLSIFFTGFDITLQYFLGKDIFGYVSTEQRNSGPFGEELKGGSYISKYFTLCFLIFFIMYLNAQIRLSKVLLFATICFFGVLLSGERAAFIHITISIFFFVTFFSPSLFKYKKYVALVILFFSLFIVFGISEDFKKRFNGTIEELNSYQNIIDSHYGAHYITAINIFMNNPISGVGQNNFRIECHDKKYENLNSKRIKDRCSTHPHNYYLQVLSDLGIINFILFLLMIGFIFRYIYINNKNQKLLLFGKLISLIILFFPFLPTGSFYNNWVSSLNWLIIAMCLSKFEKNSQAVFIPFFLKKNNANK